MKKLLVFVITALMLLTACDNTPSDTAAPETDARVTASHTTEEATQKVLSYEENLAEIYRKTNEKILPIGGFVPPSDPVQVEPVFKQLLDGGINFMVTSNEFYGTVLLCNTLRVADKTGMDLCIWTFGPNVYTKTEIVEKLKLCLEHPSVRSVYMQDEPLPTAFTMLGNLKDSINSKLGSYMDWKIGANMFPDGVFEDWYGTVDKYMSAVEPDYLCFDNYPWAANADYMGNYLGNLGEAKLLADKYGKELWSFLQTSNTGRLPDEAELRYQTNATLAMGTESLICFTVCNGAMFNDAGEPTVMYDRAKAVFTDIHAMKGVYLNYDCDGLIVVGDKTITNSIKDMSEAVLISDTSYGALSSVNSDHALVGCFKNKNGGEAFYAVNPETDSDGIITLMLDGEHDYQIWGKGGLQAVGSGSSVALELTAGDGAFVMLDTENNAYAYDEPTVPVPAEKPVIKEAEQNALVFELGINSDGTVYNKVENGLALRGFSKGEYVTVDSVPCITNYNVYTNDTKNVIKNGMTVEMKFKLTETADKKWVTLFRDPDSNLNLYRLCDSAHRKSGDTFYFGAPDGDDVVLYGDANKVLPTETWIHLIAVQSQNGQYVYVNGKQIAEGHFVFNPTEYSNFFFTDPDGVVNLSEAKIFSYAATTEQINAAFAAD